MGNTYRRFFNLFAFTLLGFAIYLNFFRSEETTPVTHSNASYGQITASAQPNAQVSQNTQKLNNEKQEKKN
jgi:hypothetical protein